MMTDDQGNDPVATDMVLISVVFRLLIPAFRDLISLCWIANVH